MNQPSTTFHTGMLYQELPFACAGLVLILPALYKLLGLSPKFLSMLLFSLFLLFLSAIDIRHGMIFNRFLLPMAGTGLLLDSAGMLVPPLEGFLAGTAGALLLLLIRWGSSGGLGGGDIKLAFVLGLWLGPPHLAAALFLAFLSGSAAGLVLLLRHRTLHLRIPFGPFLSLGAWTAALYGNDFIHYYEVLL